MAQIIILALLSVLTPGGATLQGVRVVDVVNVTAAHDEASHAFAGEGSILGETAGRKWRSAEGWFSYSLRIYEDSPLTLVCALADGGGGRESFDVLVDDQVAGTWTRESRESNAAEITVSLPLSRTAGRTAVSVKFQARAGSRTARLLEVRSVQEHFE